MNLFQPSQSSKVTKNDEDADSDDEYEDEDEDDSTSHKNYIENIDTSEFKQGLFSSSMFFSCFHRLTKTISILFKGFKIIEKSVPSMRFDSVISSGLNLSRKY